MPRYDFKCETCKAVFERIQPCDTEFVICPYCQSVSLKVFSPEGITFKWSDKEFLKQRDYDSKQFGGGV